MSSVRHSKAPAAFVSLFAPAGHRRWWHYSYRCGQCGTYQFGRAPRLEDVTGPRRASCGHKVSIVVARTYSGPA